ncbi:hypothetical protein EOE18_07420 [Novosphingobium umbonatum]|uniref:Homogentisate 1,2-dioxygenase n=1 Tax=Novosphingobium umbonatum TaxID=1908524 RepID=A0A3S2Y8A0_9SPHN|nr:hypothetical protein [Novosphingobium umbonatum]RVU05802.1 hypothetical protein EOE18_07420 [Novosphingobium umbonatum]
MRRAILLTSLLLLSSPAFAQPCAMPEGDYTPWASPTTIAAADDAGTAPPIALNAAKMVKLRPIALVHYTQTPAKIGAADNYGGLMSLHIATPGNYRLALSAGAWIDVLAPQGEQRSVAHSHGPECSGVRKMVDFNLAKGDYLVQIAASAAPSITVMALPVP